MTWGADFIQCLDAKVGKSVEEKSECFNPNFLISNIQVVLGHWKLHFYLIYKSKCFKLFNNFTTFTLRFDQVFSRPSRSSKCHSISALDTRLNKCWEVMNADVLPFTRNTKQCDDPRNKRTSWILHRGIDTFLQKILLSGLRINACLISIIVSLAIKALTLDCRDSICQRTIAHAQSFRWGWNKHGNTNNSKKRESQFMIHFR